MAEISGRVFNIRFEDYPDVLIRARSTSFGALLAVADSASAVLSRIEAQAGADMQTVSAVMQSSLQPFLDAVIDWNLEVRDAAGELVPVPVTIDGVLMLPDPGFILRAVEKWRDALMTVPESGPLPKPSTSGVPWVEGSIPMEPR